MENNETTNGKALAELEAKVVNDNGPDRVVHFLEFWREHQHENEKIKSFMTGLGQLDSMVEGFQTGEVVVITGPTGNGKTLFADSIGQRLMRMQDLKISWLSFEVPTIKMVEKYVQAEDAERLGLYVPMELKAGEFEWVKKKCLEAKLKFGCRAVIIDHLHFIVDMNTQQNMSLNIGAVMRQIKHDIAKAMNLLVFVLAHQGQAKDGEPSIDNIRDSSFIGQESDMVFVVYRTNDPVPPELQNNAKIKGYAHSFEQGYATVKIEKARRSGVYKKRLSYQKQSHWLEEV